MESKHYVAVIGRMGAGKETVFQTIRAFMEPVAVTLHQFSDPLNEILALLYLDRTRHNQQTLSRILREEYGQDLLAVVLRHRAEADRAPIVVIDGLRRPNDLAMFRQFPNSTVIVVRAEPAIRFARIKARNSRVGDAEKTWEKFLQDEQAETERLIEAISCEADYSIDNSGTREELQEKIRGLLSTIGLTPQ